MVSQKSSIHTRKAVRHTDTLAALRTPSRRPSICLGLLARLREGEGK